MQTISKKYIIKIPNFISLFYSKKKKIIILSGLLIKKSLKLNVQLFVFKSKNFLKVSSLPFFKKSNSKRANIQGTTAALIRKFIIETSVILYQKLKIIGVGFRVFNVDNFKNKLLLFKLGYSHFLYFKIPIFIEIFCLKMTKLFIFGSSDQNISQTAALIKSYKIPEPYKGKGILHDIEKISLKEGKKI